jgi:hypothetical protein
MCGRNGKKIMTRGMANFQAAKSHFDSNNLSYYSFLSKPEKLLMAVIPHLPHNAPEEDISDGLVSFVFEVTSVKQGPLLKLPLSLTRLLPGQKRPNLHCS